MNKSKHYIHVNQHRIRSNAKTGAREPVFTVKHRNGNTYGHEVIIRDEHGREMARVVYRPDNPLSCGARVWIETHAVVEVVVDDDHPVAAACPLTDQTIGVPA